MQKQKILITGGAGMLGSAFTKIIRDKDNQYDVRSFSHKEFDVCDRDRVLEAVEFSPDVVIHTAGIVNADYCEENRNECFSSHVQGTENIIELCIKSGARLLYPQSFLIFDGAQIPVNEDTKPHPLSVYGEAKLAAEKKILARYPMHS